MFDKDLVRMPGVCFVITRAVSDEHKKMGHEMVAGRNAH